MGQTAVIGLDIGTTSTKAILYDLAGQALATAQQVISLQTPHPGWAEQDPEELWQSVVKVLRSVVEQAGPTVQVRAISLASQCGSLLPADQDDQPVYPIITWIDTRAVDIVKRWQTDGTANTIRRVSGWHPQPGLALATLTWLRQNNIRIFDTAAHYFSANDFVIHRLSGEKVTDYSCANEMLFMDVASGDWSEELCELAGIFPRQLSRAEWSGQPIGSITGDVHRLTGLAPDTLVINGGHDHCAEALAMGVTEPGQLLLTCGTAWVITGVAAAPDINQLPTAMDLNFHVVRGRWTISQFLGAFGATVEWWLNNGLQSIASEPGLNRNQLYTALDSYLAETKPDDHNPLYVSPTIVGKTEGGFAGLRLGHSRAEMSRAILEGAAFELRLALDTLRQSGQPVDKLWMLGGASQSNHWVQIIADVTGIPISTTQYAHWAALGAGVLAGAGAELFAAETAHQQLNIPRQTTMPNQAVSTIYNNHYSRYTHIRDSLSV
jgi:sugar (pentulose or hexulose) kinase